MQRASRDIWPARAGLSGAACDPESTFATVQLRTTRTKGCLSRQTALTMVFRPCQSAQKRWRRLDGPGRLAEAVRGVRFVDGEPDIQDAA